MRFTLRLRTPVGQTLIRMLLGAVFLVYGADKLSEATRGDSDLAPNPYSLGGRPIAGLAGGAEVFLGLWLVSGRRAKPAIRVGAAAACLYSGALIGLAVTRGLQAPCPCGGVTGVSIGVGLVRNVLLLILFGCCLLRDSAGSHRARTM
jgi:uncharacterized membrane protein YphA (DoxX/SURF4 family)